MRAPLISSCSKDEVESYFVTDSGVVRASSFAPAHVTGIFRPALTARDPRGRGSTGAGIVLELGVRAHAEFHPGEAHQVRVMSDLGVPLPISEDVACRLSASTPGVLTVRLTHELPVGQGLGMSAAGATATALAVAAVLDIPRADAVRFAHLSDLFGGGGLGGVAAIIGGGGLEFRTRGGLPPLGIVKHRPLPGSLLVGILGAPLPSPRLLRSARFLARVTDASEGLDELLARPGTASFFDLSEQFTDRMGLAPPPLLRVIRGLRHRGTWAAQAMFGRSFFARARDPSHRQEAVRWLQGAGIPVVEISPSRSGARAFSGESRKPVR
jgi:pantoate kinase